MSPDRHSMTKVFVDEAGDLSVESIAWEHVLAAGKLMDEQEVPQKGRVVHAVVDGEFREYDIDRIRDIGKPVDDRIIKEVLATCTTDTPRKSKHFRARKQRHKS
jgi:hypothetical protein